MCFSSLLWNVAFQKLKNDPSFVLRDYVGNLHNDSILDYTFSFEGYFASFLIYHCTFVELIRTKKQETIQIWKIFWLHVAHEAGNEPVRCILTFSMVLLMFTNCIYLCYWLWGRGVRTNCLLVFQSSTLWDWVVAWGVNWQSCQWVKVEIGITTPTSPPSSLTIHMKG